MVRDTSRSAYQQIKDEGLLSARRLAVYDVLFREPFPMTGREISEKLRDPSAHKRLSELRDLGVVEEADKRDCSVTGQQAVTWRVILGALPSEVKKASKVAKDILASFTLDLVETESGKTKGFLTIRTPKGSVTRMEFDHVMTQSRSGFKISGGYGKPSRILGPNGVQTYSFDLWTGRNSKPKDGEDINTYMPQGDK